MHTTYEPPPKQAPKEAVAIVERLYQDGYVLRGQMGAAAAAITKIVKSLTVREITYSAEVLEIKKAELAAKESQRIASLNREKQRTERAKISRPDNAEFCEAFVQAAKSVLNRDEFMAIVHLVKQPVPDSVGAV